MRKSMLYWILPGLLAFSPASAFTLIKCIAIDDSVLYLDKAPKPGQCKTEIRKEVDPDANVIPASEFTRGDSEFDEEGAGPGEGGTGGRGEDEEETSNMPGSNIGALEDEEPLVEVDASNIPENEPTTGDTGATASGSEAATSGTAATGGITGAPATTAPAAVLGP